MTKHTIDFSKIYSPDGDIEVDLTSLIMASKQLEAENMLSEVERLRKAGMSADYILMAITTGAEVRIEQNYGGKYLKQAEPTAFKVTIIEPATEDVVVLPSTDGNYSL